MSVQNISSLLALSLISTPIALNPSPAEIHSTTTLPDTSLRTSVRKMKYLLADAPQLKPMGVYVGELQERWQFPSDHLPIGMTYQDIHVLSWNILDAEYMDWVIEKDSQGLKRSQIADEHIYIGDTGLTIRDQHVADMVVQMISHPTHPRSILSLQECSKPFLSHLQTKLPPNFEIIAQDGNAIIVNCNRFEIKETQTIAGVFSADSRTFQSMLLQDRDTQESLRIVNAHLPGDPNGPARYEFAKYLTNIQDPSITTFAMGDMNFNELEMNDALFKASAPFSLYSPYCTNISVAMSPNPFFSKAIDHFITTAKIEMNDAEQVLSGLSATHQLLNKGAN